MVDIISGLSALKTAFDIAKELNSATSAYNEAEIRLKISELYSALSQARIELADSQEEIHSLNKKIKELTETKNESDDIVFRNGVYYRKVEIDGKPNGPFCPTCFEGSPKRITSLSPLPKGMTIAKYRCNICKGAF